MFINKASDGKNNLCGEKIALRRSQMGISQWELADRLQIAGLDIDKNAIQRIEAGKRFVTDIELRTLSAVLDLSKAGILTSSECHSFRIYPTSGRPARRDRPALTKHTSRSAALTPMKAKNSSAAMDTADAACASHRRRPPISAVPAARSA